LSDLRVPHEEDGKLCFYFKKYKIFTKTPSDRVERRKGLCFKLFHSSTAQSVMVDTFESHSVGMTKE
jgi:hypothetical protein